MSREIENAGGALRQPLRENDAVAGLSPRNGGREGRGSYVYCEDKAPGQKTFSELHEVAPVASSPLVERDSIHVQIAVNTSFAANCFLFAIKVFAAGISGSMTVIASCVDSSLDILSGLIIFFTNRAVKFGDHAKYPGGKAKFEPISIVIFATFMCTSAMQLMLSSVKQLMEGFNEASEDNNGGATEDGKTPGGENESTEWLVYAILLASAGIKLCLFLYCSFVVNASQSDSVKALRDDHRNDTISNLFAALVLFVRDYSAKLWWLDDGGAIIIGVYIVVNWIATLKEQVRYLSGYNAQPDFYDEVAHVAKSVLGGSGDLDAIRAYHFGPKYLVELDVVVSSLQSLKATHSALELLRKRVSELEDVEKCFVWFKFEGCERLSRPPSEIDVDEAMARSLSEQHNRHSNSRVVVPQQPSTALLSADTQRQSMVSGREDV